MIEIIQGDTLNITITVEQGAELINELWFSCKALEISEKCTKIDDTHYMIDFGSELTNNCNERYLFFDITAMLKDNQVNTLIYNQEIRILKKENAINGN